MKSVSIIGSGIAGLAAAVRLAKAGFEVTVFESNSYPGGKISELKLGEYRFDKGPSLFTLPRLVDELTGLSGTDKKFEYKQLSKICNYFYEDGTRLSAYSDNEKFANELAEKLNESKQTVLMHLKQSAKMYKYTADIFLNQSLHRAKNYFNLKTIRAIANLRQLKLNKTMHQVNAQHFKNNKTVQLFDRYATYNGSNPYQAPALLNIIPHLEYNIGAYFPLDGMHAITKHVYQMALDLGVTFLFNHKVSEILLKTDRVEGVKVNEKVFRSDIVLSDADMHVVYDKLLPRKYRPEKLLNQEKSSSAFIFYWGIKKEFEELDVHNILFSANYEAEFKQLFKGDKPYDDPTIYIHISSRIRKEDAPKGSENWFILINAPHNQSHQIISYSEELRANVISKINRILNTDIEKYIEEEATLDPLEIEKITSSYGGSLYGNSSNNKFSAFLRHSNYSSQLKGLYFCGGSVHPGGGIPLCLLSAKIASELIKEKEIN